MQEQRILDFIHSHYVLLASRNPENLHDGREFCSLESEFYIFTITSFLDEGFFYCWQRW